MEKNGEEDRCRAIQRHLAGEASSSIYRSMGYSAHWFYKWLRRYETGGPQWFQEQSRRPHSLATRSPREVEEMVCMVRLSLYNRGLFHGAQAIRWELEDLLVRPLASVRTISRMLVRRELTHRRPGRYQSKGRRYPAPKAERPGDVHQSDFVGPCYLSGPLRFYTLNSIDLVTRRCAVEPMLTRAGQCTVDALWATWTRLGMPHYQQVDNESVFSGSPTHPRGMGILTRLCLLYDIQPWFIPPAEPWRNAIVEKFNQHWRQRFKDRVPMTSAADLRRESPRFEHRHNTSYRYSALGGRTPARTLVAADVRLRFPPTARAPRHPLPKPQTGRYHLIRFVRSQRVLDIFGEKFPAPPEATYEYVRATIDVERQRLCVFLDDALIDEHSYPVR